MHCISWETDRETDDRRYCDDPNQILQSNVRFGLYRMRVVENVRGQRQHRPEEARECIALPQ